VRAGVVPRALVAAGMLLAGAPIGLATIGDASPGWAQEAAPDAGREQLQRAMTLQLRARSIRDLDETIALCERALREGLGEEDAELAHQIAASCLFQKANGIAAAVVDRARPDPRWQQLREIALNDLEKAIEHVPKLTEAYPLIYKLCLLPAGDRTQGLRAANKAIELLAENPPQLAEAYLARARFREKPEDQLADLDKAAELTPDNPQPKQLRAAMLFDQGKYAEAADAFRALIQADEENAAYHLALGEAMANIEGQFDSALEAIRRGIELNPKSTQGYLLRARLHASRENADAALTDLNQALEADPKDVSALLFRAEIHLFRVDAKAARADVDRALQIRPGLVAGILLRSRVHASEQKYDDAVRDMELLIQNDPKNVDFRLQTAAYHNAGDRPRKAIKMLTEIVEEDKGNWRALRSRGDALLSIGKHAEAIQDFTRALELKPDESGILNNLAWVLATSPEDQLRDGKRSIELGTKACELTEFKEAHILSTLASGYAETGDFETAVRWSSKAVELGEGTVKEQLQKELDSYKAAKPWREKQDTKEKPDVPRRNLLET